MPVIDKELECEQPVVTETPDMLDRQSFVDELINITNMLSASKKNVCFALNGSWGVGKSFVLKMFEEQIVKIQTPETTMGKFLLFRYDCWKYDYYDEPLTAIVAALLDSIDEQVYLFSEEKRTKIKGILKVIGVKLAEKVNEKIEEKIGIDIKEIWDVLNDIDAEAAKKIAEEHSFDDYFDFNRILNKLRGTIESLAREQTVIFVVDELDRCLPEYTIKVLERLHHVFDGISNVQMILSIDKSQLEHTVKQIYGSSTDVQKYLEKFIAFEISLPIGSLNEQAEYFFENYYSHFNNIKDLVSCDELADFKHFILEGINTRSRIAIIEKCNLLHRILLKDDAKLDSVFMCVEMFLTVLKFYNLNIRKAKENFSINTLFEANVTCAGNESYYTLPGLAILRTKYRDPYTGYDEFDHGYMGTAYMSQSRNDRIIVMCHDIWGILLACYRAILGFEGDFWHFQGNSDQSIKQYALDYWKLLKTIT